MLTFIKTNYRAGDTIEINCSTGTFIGTIEYVTDRFIVLRQPNDKVCGIAAQDVRSFTADLPPVADPHAVPATLAPACEQPVEGAPLVETDTHHSPTEAHEVQTAQASAAPVITTIAQALAEEARTPSLVEDENEAAAPTETTDSPQEQEVLATDETEQKDETDFLSLIQDNRPKIKVLGHIDLDKVDPNRKTIFKKKNKEAEVKTEQEAEAPQQTLAEKATEVREEAQPAASATTDEPVEQAAASQPATPCRKTKVRACGRVVNYNKEKHYGYIHDFNGNGVLHFVLKNVVDPDLHDKLEFNTKLTYSIEERPRGKEAVCIHKPTTFPMLMKLAETYIDSNQLQTALTLAEHIIEANPDYVDAQAMAEDMRKGLAIQQRQKEMRKKIHIPQKANNFSSFIQPPKVSEYARGKEAYLAKHYEEAEQHYLRAIETGEKAESSVKDLLTLTIARYKQAEAPEQKQALADHARELFDRLQHHLPETLTNKQFIAINFLLPLEAYEDFLAAVDELLIDPSISENPVRLGFYLWQKAIAYNKLGMVDDALAMIEEGLQLAPNSPHLINLKNNIYNPHTGKRVTELPAVAIAPSPLSVTNPAPTVQAPAEAQPAADTAPAPSTTENPTDGKQPSATNDTATSAEAQPASETTAATEPTEMTPTDGEHPSPQA